MTDLLIRDVPDEVVAALDADAKRAGLSRSEYLRRLLTRNAAKAGAVPVRVADLARFADAFVDLRNDEVMGRAWR